MLTHLLAFLILAQPRTSVPVPPSPPELRTIAEASDFKSTSTHAEVLALVDAIVEKAPEVARRATVGHTHEGRDMAMIVLSDPPVDEPGDAFHQAERFKKPLVFIFANIHAGEVDAKEASLMLARSLALGEDRELLKKLVVVIMPNYNADGNDRFGPNEKNRSEQDGPVNGMGIRHNSRDLDLNRDWCKLKANETRNMVAFLNSWKPRVVVDGHTTDGSYHRYLITHQSPKCLAGDTRLNDYARDTFLAEITKNLRARTDIDMFTYGNFEGEHESPPRQHTQWWTTSPQPRYSTHYLGLRGCIGILSESYSHSPYKDRVLGSYEFFREILRYTAANSEQVMQVTRDAADAGAGKDGRLADIVIRTKEVAAPGKQLVKGYVEETKDGKSIATSEPKDYECEVIDRAEPALSVKRPAGYMILYPVADATYTLSLHGVASYAIGEPTTIEAEQYTITSFKRAEKPYQGHRMISDVEVSKESKTITAGLGAMYIPTDQPLGNLVSYLLEPQCEDGLTTWNFFDDFLSEGAAFPVVRVVKPLHFAGDGHDHAEENQTPASK